MNDSTPVREFALHAACFGGRVSAHVGGGDAGPAAIRALESLHEADRRLSRFRPGSDLCRLNRDQREEVPADPLVVALAAAIREAGELSEGLVDGTLIDELEAAGYVNSMSERPPAPGAPVREAPSVPPARGRWRTISADTDRWVVRRPRGVRIDSGGLGKGLAADRAGALLADAPTFCVNACGDMVIGGTAGLPRSVRIEHPQAGRADLYLTLRHGGLATSGITRRAWRSPDGEFRHHLIDPRTGRPAATGINQVTALAPTALEAERLAKAALLAGPAGAPTWLPHGGIVICEDGSVEQIAPARALANVT